MCFTLTTRNEAASRMSLMRLSSRDPLVLMVAMVL